MKKTTILLTILLVTIFTYSQKLEKIKGNKNVILTERKLDSVHTLELNNNIKLTLVKSEDSKLAIYADENLHDIVTTDLNEGVLSISLTNRIVSKREFKLTLYIPSLSKIILNDNSFLENSDYLESDDLVLILNNKSKTNLLIKAANLSIETNDSTKNELQIQSDSTTIKMQENARIKGTLKSKKFALEMESKSTFSMSGNVDNASYTTKNNATVKGSNLKVKTVIVDADNTSDVFVNASDTLEVSAKNKAKIAIYGNAKIDLKVFKGTASLLKKE